MKTIAVIRKPLDGTVASNVMKHSCGGLNIDATRIGNSTRTNASKSGKGRFPANLILNDIAAKALDEQTGDRPSTGNSPSTAVGSESIFRPNQGGYQKQGPIYNDVGGASRYFKNVKGDNMKTIAISRKPLAGTVVSNVLEHGCGGLNIKAGR